MIIRHIHYASERETQTETQEKQASEELQSEEEKCMEADVHQHGTSQAAREESWLPWKQGRLPLEEMILNKPLNINPVGVCRGQTSRQCQTFTAPYYISGFILSSRWH